jgi:hypothetical protein
MAPNSFAASAILGPSAEKLLMSGRPVIPSVAKRKLQKKEGGWTHDPLALIHCMADFWKIGCPIVDRDYSSAAI